MTLTREPRSRRASQIGEYRRRRVRPPDWMTIPLVPPQMVSSKMRCVAERTLELNLGLPSHISMKHRVGPLTMMSGDVVTGRAAAQATATQKSLRYHRVSGLPARRSTSTKFLMVTISWTMSRIFLTPLSGLGQSPAAGIAAILRLLARILHAY